MLLISSTKKNCPNGTRIHYLRAYHWSTQWAVARFSKVPKTFRVRKAVPKTPIRSSCKAGLFICSRGEKIKITAEFRALRRLPFDDTKRTMSPETRPKSFWTFEKRVPAPCWPDSSTGEHCTGIAEVRVRVPFRPFFRYCLSSVAKLRRSSTLKIESILVYFNHLNLYNAVNLPLS